jgi:hypothetical protein
MKREKKLTKRERKAITGLRPSGQPVRQQEHIHCIACGRHLDPGEFDRPALTAKRIRCAHGTTFPTCTEHEESSRDLLAQHDRTGEAVKTAAAWH